MPPLGYEVAIHRSLTEPILLGGVPRRIAILNTTFVAAMGLGLHSFYCLPVGLLFHLLAAIAVRRDPQFFDCLQRHLGQKRLYRV